MPGSTFARSRARYSYLVADLRTGVELDELPLHGVSFSTVLNDSGEFRGQLAIGDRRIGIREPQRVTEPGRTALYVARDGVLVWGGIIWTSKYSSPERILEIGAAGFLSYFDRRRVLRPDYDPATHDVATLPPVPFTNIDQAEIARALVRGAQSHPGGNIGIQVDPPPPEGTPPRWPRTLEYRGYELKSVGEALRELAALDNGPDILMDVAFGADGRAVRRLRVGEPHLGQPGAPHFWEYGANLVSYTWPQDGASMANRVFALGSGSEEGQLIEPAVDAAQLSAGFPLTETEVSYVHVEDRALLRSIATAELSTVADPVVLPELVVRADLEPTLGSYQVGDHAQVLVKDGFFPGGREFRVRILGIEVSPGDDAGEELVTLTVAPLREG
ncbi:hypothetical protein Val02_72030 [Virgisporangium aliadipatigenens]|uniref:Uncharacterized protein n=1 Tax=Virgisporangium aliadipatigenens TaxID=741659 RepID=A0A8J3YTR6_9ACTN|nr:hypothetical protein [Virgisporangium aliadipatigenens]GIJ50317.1 hypothetical protein Val02_72030 [Virgisporangium aliadipatigenens]